MIGRRLRLGVGVAVCVLVAGAGAATGGVKLTAGPRAVKDGDATVITFTVSAPTDVEVAVVDAAGKVVRHLAAGVLGGKKPPPPPLKPGLAQRIVWDSQDDDGRPAKGEAFRVRVRVGMRAKFGRAIGDAGRISGKVSGLATDDRGHLYVASGCVYSSAPVVSLGDTAICFRLIPAG